MHDPSLFLNRELSWLDFNARALHEALDARNPLLERVKFLAIFATNLDEFYMVRVGGLRRRAAAGASNRSPTGCSRAGDRREPRRAPSGDAGHRLVPVPRDAPLRLRAQRGEESEDLLAAVEEQIVQRRFGEVVRLQVQPEMPADVRQLILEELNADEEPGTSPLADHDVHETSPFLGLGDLLQLAIAPLEGHPLRRSLRHESSFGNDVEAVVEMRLRDLERSAR